MYMTHDGTLIGQAKSGQLSGKRRETLLYGLGAKGEFGPNGHSSGCSVAYVFYPECHCERKPVTTKHRPILEFDALRSPLPLVIELEAF